MKPTLARNISDLFLEQVLEKITKEFVPKIKYCLSLLSEEEIWYQPNEHCNSIGVLVLHLEGNARQWILSGACGQKDTRNRAAEFRPNGKMHPEKLTGLLDRLCLDINRSLPKVLPGELLAVRKVQCYNETILAILMHATEHFSYHTGQIIYLTKMIKNIDTGFYSGLELDQVS